MANPISELERVSWFRDLSPDLKRTSVAVMAILESSRIQSFDQRNDLSREALAVVKLQFALEVLTHVLEDGPPTAARERALECRDALRHDFNSCYLKLTNLLELFKQRTVPPRPNGGPR